MNTRFNAINIFFVRTYHDRVSWLECILPRTSLTKHLTRYTISHVSRNDIERHRIQDPTHSRFLQAPNIRSPTSDQAQCLNFVCWYILCWILPRCPPLVFPTIFLTTRTPNWNSGLERFMVWDVQGVSPACLETSTFLKHCDMPTMLSCAVCLIKRAHQRF